MDQTIKRRTLLAGGVGAALAGLFGRTSAARAEDGEPLVLGKENRASSPTTLDYAGGAATVGLDVRSGDAIAVGGETKAGIGLWGHRGAPVDLRTLWKAAVHGDDLLEHGNGVCGTAPLGIGVIGRSANRIGMWAAVGDFTADDIAALEPAAIHASSKDERAAMCGRSGAGPGVMGESRGGVGVLGFTGELHDAAHEHGAAGVVGMGSDRIGVFGESESEVGVMGESARFVGVWGCQEASPVDRLTVKPAGVMGSAIRAGTYAVCGVNGSGVGVRGMAVQADGVALEGEHTAGGLALQVKGRAQFASAGRGVVPAEADQVSVPSNELTAGSGVLVTLNGDPDGASHWVEVDPKGGGFTLFLSKRMKHPLAFAFFGVEQPTPDDG